MEFSPKEIQELEMLGVVVLYRPANKLLRKAVVAGIVCDYDLPTGIASLHLVEHGYHADNVPYNAQLEKPNTWCYKEDLRKLPKSEEILPSGPPASVEEPSPQGAASEDDTATREPSRETVLNKPS